MKWSTKGIGWLIAGLLICAAAFPGAGIADMMGTIMIGVVFIAVYVMRQKFRPAGIGWFIAGGIFIAFCVESMLDVAGGLFSGMDSGNYTLSDSLIGLIVACGFLLVFYLKNKDVLRDVVNGADYSEESEFPYQEEVFREETAEEPAEETAEETVETIEVVVEPADTAEEKE